VFLGNAKAKSSGDALVASKRATCVRALEKLDAPPRVIL
jgi:hypothetical protein